MSRTINEKDAAKLDVKKALVTPTTVPVNDAQEVAKRLDLMLGKLHAANKDLLNVRVNLALITGNEKVASDTIAPKVVEALGKRLTGLIKGVSDLKQGIGKPASNDPDPAPSHAPGRRSSK